MALRRQRTRRPEGVGHPTERIDDKLKVTGAAPYAHEQHAAVENPAYGVIAGAAIGKGRIEAIDTSAAAVSPGVLAVVTAENAGPVQTGEFYVDRLLACPEVNHYHQAIAVVVAEWPDNRHL